MAVSVVCVGMGKEVRDDDEEADEEAEEEAEAGAETTPTTRPATTMMEMEMPARNHTTAIQHRTPPPCPPSPAASSS